MKKLTSPLLIAVILSLLFLAGCKKHSDSVVVTDPFNTTSESRNLIVVISDLHCGADISYSQINANLQPLAEMLAKIRTSRNVKELVIAGDLLDEWFVPATTDPYQGQGQSGFADRVAATNHVVFDQIRAIITDGIIKVSYVPGNHDLAITQANVERVLPGINQSRDAGAPGVGSYSPDNFPQIVIEHGNRYNLFASPDPISNQDVAPGTILPPGYFSTRISALHFVQNCSVPADTVPTLLPNPSGGTSQELMYGYWQIWKGCLLASPIQNLFNEKMIVTNMDGFTGTYSVDDVLPFQNTPGGTISAVLYDSVQETWQQRCALNHVAVSVSAAFAVANAFNNPAVDTMASIQYFMNPASNVRVVVFGHTHVPLMKTEVNHAGQKCVYANSGTWIDSNMGNPTMDFVVITPQGSDPSTQTSVTLYNYMGRTFNVMNQASLRF